MNRFSSFTKIPTVIIFGLMLSSQVTAQSQNPGWIEDLEYELAAKQECEVAEYLGINEGKIGSRYFYFAKVKCVDGREFDASKTEPQEEFEIRICEVQSC